MTLLLVDIGNTRVKWATLGAANGRGKPLSRMRALVHGGRAAVMRQVVDAAPRNIERVLAVCVAGAALERALAAAVRQRFSKPVEFVRSARHAAGVRNGYRETWRLGADRWVSAIAAHHLAGARAALVVNIGTALTIDAVDAQGRHRGGAIAPGPSTMIASLLQGTHGIRRRATGATAGIRSRRLFATDTASGLAAGASYAAAALVDRAAAEGRLAFGRAPLLLLTGGAADALRPYIKSSLRAHPDLVLRGLAVLARAPQAL